MTNNTLKQGSLTGTGKISNESYLNRVMFIVLILLFGIASLTINNYFSTATALNLIANNWYIVILGIGVTFLLVSGHLDMSVGGIVAMAGVLSAYFCQPDNKGFSRARTRAGAAVRRRDPTDASGLSRHWLAQRAVYRENARGVHHCDAGVPCRSRAGIGQVAALGAQRSAGMPDIFGVVGNVPLFGPIKIAGRNRGGAGHHRAVYREKKQRSAEGRTSSARTGKRRASPA